MRLSKRLKAICDMVPEESSIIDIGTDHGYVPIYLNKYKNCKCIATDISGKSLNKAINNAKKANVKINFKQTDGLKNINLNDEIIIISGMGSKKILEILNEDIKNDLILSTNNDFKILKEKLNYTVFKEIIIDERKKYHIIYLKKAI